MEASDTNKINDTKGQPSRAKNQQIVDADDIAAGMAYLTQHDSRLAAITPHAGEIPLRLSAPGFASLARIIIAQQVSKQSAEAITARFEQLCPDQTPQAYLSTSDEVRSQIGLSRPKKRALEAASRAIIETGLDLEGLCTLDPSDAIKRLTTVKGIGPWTAEVYLLFCAGHRDIFPAGDLALQIALQEALDLPERPNTRQAAKLAEQWMPWRSVAARLLWAWYGAKRQRKIMP